MLNKEIFFQYIAGLQSLYDKELSEFVIGLYYEALKELTEEQFKAGVNKIIKNRVYSKFPQPGEIIQSSIGNMENNKICYAEDNLRKAVKNYGAYYSVIFDDPVIHIMLENHFGSWIKFCRLEAEEMESFFKFEFEDLYKAYSSQKRMSIKTKMAGIHDARNEGQFDKEIARYDRYIGDKEKALEWVKVYENRVLENSANRKIIQISEAKAINKTKLEIEVEEWSKYNSPKVAEIFAKE